MGSSTAVQPSIGIVLSLDVPPAWSLQGRNWTACSAPVARAIPPGPCPHQLQALATPLGSSTLSHPPPSSPGWGLRDLCPHLMSSCSVVMSKHCVWHFWLLLLGSPLLHHNQTWIWLYLSKLYLMKAWFGSQRQALDGFPLCLQWPKFISMQCGYPRMTKIPYKAVQKSKA